MKKNAVKKRVASKKVVTLPKLQINLNGKFAWKTEKEINALIRKKESINITSRSKKQASKNILNEINKTQKRERRTSTSNDERTAGKQKRIVAPPIKYSKKEFENIREQVKRAGRGNPYFKKEYYEKILKKVKENQSKNIDLTQTLIELRKSNKKIKTIQIVTDKKATHYNVHNVVDRYKQEKVKTNITIKDFEGKEHKFKDMEKALILLRKLNNRINDTIEKIESESTKIISIYVTIPQQRIDTQTGTRKIKITSNIMYDFENYDVQGWNTKHFDFALKND